MATTDSILGFDVGTHSVKLVRVERKRKRFKVTHTETLRIPPDMTSINEVVLPWLTNLELPKTSCVIGIPGPQTMFQPLALSKEDPRSLSQAVEMEMARYHDMADEIMIYDYVTVGSGDETRQLLIAMSRPAALQHVLDLPTQAEIEVDDIIPSPVAMFRALSHMGASAPGPCVYVDIGHSNTSIAIGNSDGLMFARGFAIGGSLFTDAVARVSGLTLRHAEDLKVGEVSVTGGKKDMCDAMTESADIWLSEVEACLAVYRTSYPEEKDQPCKVILAGGGAELKGLPQYTEATLGIKVAEARLSATEPSLDNPATYSTALGYALIGLGAETSRLSLLPAAAKEALFLRRQSRHWIASAVCAALILGLSVIAGRRDIRREERRLTEQREILKTCERLGDEIEVIEKQTAMLLTMAAPVQRNVRNGLFYQNLMELIARAKHSRDWITMVCDAESYTMEEEFLDTLEQEYVIAVPEDDPAAIRRLRRAPTETKKEVKQPHASSSAVIVEGYTATRDLSTVKKLIAALNTAPMIKHADLLSDDKVVSDPGRDRIWSQVPGRRFVIVVEQTPLEERSDSSIIPAWRMRVPPKKTPPSKPDADKPKPEPAPFTVKAGASSTHLGEDGEGAPSSLVDGKMTTRWSSDYEEPQQIILTLSKTSPVEKLRLHWETASAKSYTVAVADDKAKWRVVYHGRDGAIGPRLDEVKLGGASVRRIRVSLLNRVNKNWGFSLYEIQVIPAK